MFVENILPFCLDFKRFPPKLYASFENLSPIVTQKLIFINEIIESSAIGGGTIPCLHILI